MHSPRAKSCRLLRETAAMPFLAGAATMTAALLIIALVLKAFGAPHG